MAKLAKFKGTFQELQDSVLLTSVNGEWQDFGNHKQFRADTGAILNWWESNKTISFQGNRDEAAKLESAFFAVKSDGEIVATKSVTKKSEVVKTNVFVVYGHDEPARNQLETMLRRWGLEPLILDQLPSKGQTIIEKLEEYTADVEFGVVLATPDDEGHRREHEDEKTYRARQNVVLELGILLTKLGRDKVAILIKEQDKMERPSDIQGLIYIPFKDDLQKEAGSILAKEMAAQGYAIDIKRL